MAYELWDTEFANLVGSYDSQAAALTAVRTAMRRLGAEVVGRLALAYEDTDGSSHDIASGQALSALAGEGSPRPDASLTSEA